MEPGTKLALQAILQGLRRSGVLGDHAMAVIIDELRYAAREADEQLFARSGRQIEELAEDLHQRRDFAGIEGGQGIAAFGRPKLVTGCGR